MSFFAAARRFAPALLFVLGSVLFSAAPARARSIPSIAAAAQPTTVGVLAIEDWSWDAFCKFWKKQAGKTSGVVGVVLLVGIAAVIIILSKGRG